MKTKIYDIYKKYEKYDKHNCGAGLRGFYPWDSGFGDFFGHAVGHGVGLSIHEMPKISPKSGDVLSIGNVFTVEPGIYLPDKFGVRIENIVSIEESGVNILTNISTDLSIV